MVYTGEFRNIEINPQEVAIMGFAENIILHSPAIKKEDMHKLLEIGLMNAEIIDILPVASARNFWSKRMDAFGSEGDIDYLDLVPNVHKAIQNS